MAYVAAPDSSVSVSGIFGGLVANLRKSVADAMAYNATLTELQALSARELDDLGLAGSDLRRIARESVYGA